MLVGMLMNGNDPPAGLGVARSIRAAFEDATVIGDDYAWPLEGCLIQCLMMFC